MEEGRVGAYGERKIRVCPQRRPRNASGHRARRNQRPKGWRHWIASWRFQPNPFVKWSRVSRSKVEQLSDLVGIHWADRRSRLPWLPVDSIEPTPFQRDLSEAHHKKLAGVIEKTGTYLDPIISVPAPNGGFWTPNGRHRLEAMRRLGAKAITTLIAPNTELAWQILALNTEKAHTT